MTVTYYVFHAGNKIFQKNEDHSEGQIASHMSYLWEFWRKYIKKGAHKVCAVRQGGAQSCYAGPAAWKQPLPASPVVVPSVIKRCFPERSDAQWHALSPADKQELLKIAQQHDAKGHCGSKASLPTHTEAKGGIYSGAGANRRPFLPATVKGVEGVPMFKWIQKRSESSKQARNRAVEARLHGVGLGAMPYVVKKWFPEITEDEWTAAESGQYAGANTAELLAKANAAEAQWQAGIKQYKAEGACDATQPGRLAGALRAYLLANGGEAENLGDDEDKFGELECKEWMRVFNKQPDAAAAKAAIQTFQGGMGKAVANHGWKVITLADICGSSVKLPVCKPAAGPPPPPKPECDAKTPCPSGHKCVDGKCVKQVAEEPKKSNWLWLLALGAGGLGIAAAAGAFPKGPKDLPPREAERQRLMENKRGRKRSRR